MFELTDDQRFAIDSIVIWLGLNRNSEFVYTLGGFAGTGKTSVISEARKEFSKELKIAFCCFTGKATSVLKRKLGSNVCPTDNVSTIHSLIYDPKVDDDTGDVIDWILKPTIKQDIIVIDEASMVSEEIMDDLKSYNKPIVCVGDHGQLPPVNGTGFNLMFNPMVKLEKIHRQAEGNPIIQLSKLAREDGFVPYKVFGTSVVKAYKSSSLVSDFINASGDFSDTVIICGFNNTRLKLNQNIRKHLNYRDHYPMPGERVICLRNNKEKAIYNGMQGTVIGCVKKDKYLDMEIAMDGLTIPYSGPVSYEGFNNPEAVGKQSPVFYKGYHPLKRKKPTYPDIFDFGYCITCHKSQGSEWSRVMVIEEIAPKLWEHKRWLYTAVTRAREQLLIVR